ncbi:hypothetical protein FZEAL_2883 [Fusarium zealandicum]|uniref:Zn(2)-C6 fungal-type domain-containing protein n=1 Tax=Fusarium zealandicum TaxID=1053134 RepID=A0A8H4UQL5_9HYPO|nr:hypothetical protein FZEAL_2883 [Fusarium zealandicum]
MNSNTCRRRKLKCNQQVPVCLQCSKSERYCDWSEKPTQFGMLQSNGRSWRLTDLKVQYQNLPSPDNPRLALQNGRIARLFHSYTSEISLWYDLSDSTRAFGVLVPSIALDEPLLFCAVIALAAMRTCKTSASSFRKTAEFYHHRCVQQLILLSEGDELISRGVALAATCLLRSYEILDGENDPNMHLRGAYSMASLHDVLSGNLQPGLPGAGFWNYLREDITFSLFEKCPLKMDLESTPLLISHRSDQDQLNSITLILGKIINKTSDQDITDSQWSSAAEMLKQWRFACPEHIHSFSRQQGQPGTSHFFPAVWFLQPCHAATIHYYLVSLTLLCIGTDSGRLEELGKLDLLGFEPTSKESLLEAFALEICGIAFTAMIPSVLVNAFGPIAYSVMLRTQMLRPTLMKGARSLATVASTSPLGVIQPSAKEIENVKLGSRNLEKAVRHMHKNGLVVVEDAVPHGHLDLLNKKMVEDAHILQARGDKGPFNYNKGNIQQDAPPVAEYFLPSIFTNRIATQITSAVLGPRPKWTFCSANSAMATLPGETPQRQPVHSDADFAHPDHPFALVVNVPLVTTKPENGSTEIWLGTHNGSGLDAQEGAHGDRASGRIQEGQLRQREKVSPPLQPVIKKGSIIVRDLRLWHAGMPNNTQETRVMLAMIHFAPWFRNRMKLELGDDVKPILANLEKEGKLGLHVPVNWVSREAVLEGYLNRGFGNSYDFDQEP